MKIIQIEYNPITGTSYHTVELPAYNNNIHRRLDRHYRQVCDAKRNRIINNKTKHK